ncbi:MAG: pseudouridylate synthase family protein [Parachlamydiales bacterium]|nr:pseudouridylate synthase family protein [Parachlamydiales bacterium]
MTLRWRQSHSARLIEALKMRVDPSFSARFIKRALEANVCRVNGRIERFASAALSAGDIIELKDRWESFDEKSSDEVSILYEDRELLIINKAPLSVCTDSYFSQKLQKTVWLAHRLDKDTTGVLLFGKDPGVAVELQECFKQRLVQKEYLAIVDRAVEKKEGVIETRLAKKGSYQGQTIWGSCAGQGLYAKTAWHCVSVSRNASLLLCRPETGRTHQIRVHLAEMGHPIIFDRQYSSHFQSKIYAARPMLHSLGLKLQWRGRSLEINAPLPQDFIEVLNQSGLHYEAEKRCSF